MNENTLNEFLNTSGDTMVRELDDEAIHASGSGLSVYRTIADKYCWLPPDKMLEDITGVAANTWGAARHSLKANKGYIFEHREDGSWTVDTENVKAIAELKARVREEERILEATRAKLAELEGVK